MTWECEQKRLIVCCAEPEYQHTMYVSFVYKELHRAVLVTEAFVLHAWLPLVI